MNLSENTADHLPTQNDGGCEPHAIITHRIRRLQIITLVWMSAECLIALAAAWRARSPLLLAFGADSFVELMSALVVLLQFVPRLTISETQASKLAGILLFLLGGIVTLTSVLALFQKVQPETSWMGIGVAIAALIVMPALSRAKRNTGKATGNIALSADAIQSATCAYLASLTLVGLALNAIFHIRWIDPAAALVAVPIICLEGRKALQGKSCCCSG